MAPPLAAISPTDPGELSVYETLGPIFDPGYGIVFILPAPHIATNSSMPPAFSDPRGVLVSAPLNKLSYEIYENIAEVCIYDNSNLAILSGLVAGMGGIGGAVIGSLVQAGLGQSLSGQVFARSETMVSIIAFEGRDIIDLPTKDLKTDGKAIIVPDNVFLPVYAGNSPFMSPSDTRTFATKAANEYISKSSSNMVQQIQPSDNPPIDSMTNPKAWWASFRSLPNRFVDVASNAIVLNGSANYISYVSCDKPLFRDVIYLSTGAIGQGGVQPHSNTLLLMFAGPWSNTIVQVFRYAWVDTNTGTKQSPLYQWRLSESFGVAPANTDQTPQEAIKTGGNAALDTQAVQQKCYVYNLNDSNPDIDNSTFPGKILKTGITRIFAAAKLDSSSPLYDKAYKAQIIPPVNSSFAQSNLQVKRVFGLTPGVGNAATEAGQIETNFGTVVGGNILLTERVYQSPYFQINMNNNGRLGLEYAVHKAANMSVFGMDSVITLASVRPSAQGVGVFYDPCLSAMVCIFIDNGLITQRLFDDKKLLDTGTIAPSNLNAFLLAEILQRSSGSSVFHPPYGDIGQSVAGTTGSVSISADTLPTLLIVSPAIIPTGSTATTTVLRLYAESTPQDSAIPLFEVVVPIGIKGTTNEQKIPIPPIQFNSFQITNPNGSVLKQILGSKKSPFLSQITKIPVIDPAFPTDAFSDWQLKAVIKEDFPISATNVSGCAVHTKGHAFVTYENNNRVNLGFRPSISNTFLPIRDVCMRVPENFTTSMLSGQPGGLPNASQPFLVADLLPNKIFLFYVYKTRILIKSIPLEIIEKEQYPFNTTIYPDETEAKISKNIHRMIPCIVYDGGQGVTPDIEADRSIGAIKAPTGITTTTTITTVPSVKCFSACITKGGLLLCFIQDGDRIVVRKSSDGIIWTDAFPQNTIFIPSKAGAKVIDGEAPVCFFEEGQGAVFLFLVLESCLFQIKLPQQLFLETADKSQSYLTNMIPELIYGQLNDDGSLPASLADRRITVQPAVIERQKTQTSQSSKEVISPHRISVARFKSGPIRIFFNNINQRLQTLISSDDGKAWQTEDQFMKNRDRKK